MSSTGGSPSAAATFAPKAAPGASRVRYRILALAFLGLSLNYLDRANLSVALPFMTEDLGLELSNAEKGLILGAFFWAYDGAMLAAAGGSATRSERAGPSRSPPCGGRSSPP